MDKSNTPLKRPRKHMDAFKHSIFVPPKHKAEMERQKRYRKESKSWLDTIFQTFKKVARWFGWGRKYKDSKGRGHSRCWEKRRARNRRRNQIAKESRRRNR